MIKGKKVIVIGDRDGIPSQALEDCVRSAGGNVIFAMTHCYV
ncbi:Glycine reductase complex selenoprotein A [Desulfosporosinus youngiae DSM 17734]|nr:Glycine reductase complex selenoprotein A [Desulfosporosinus youngiae DSM 17734]